MIRIVHLTDDPALGGVNRTLDELVRRLDSRFRQSRVHVTPTKGLPPVLPADVIHIHFTASWRKLVWLRALRQRNPGAVLVLVEHSYTRSYEELHVPDRRRFRAMLWLTCRLMDHVVAVSEAQGHWLMQVANLSAGKISFINPHTDLSDLRCLPPPQRGPGPLKLCGYGRFVSQKGFDTLIAAMRMVSPKTATLRLVGLGPDEALLLALAADQPHVAIEGPVPGPAALLGEVDAVAIPSRFEAFGNVGLEARAAARPMILSAVDGLTAQSFGIAELVVPPEDPVALAQAITWLAKQDITALGLLARRSADGAEAHTIDGWNRFFERIARHRARASHACANADASGAFIGGPSP